MFLDYFALGLLIFVVLFLFYGLIALHDIPYEISKSRNHPHQDAIHVAGWVSLFTLHVLWPFLWIWATLWREDRGWGFKQIEQEQQDAHHRVDVLTEQVTGLQQQITQLSLLLSQQHASVTPQDASSQAPLNHDPAQSDSSSFPLSNVEKSDPKSTDGEAK
ncbi:MULTISPECIES: DUF3302 domain-containing protein [Vibrio]|uniref:DUF3302 domain-containing protein n=1 Tax=Vibrio algicola TaxID=2662262 RepID=A0A5Q0TEU1_9VIBR|nr:MULTISPECIES: DUF3302 domain-containing protein [Vibrio]MBD1575192.1 DUF3302 domain-containing protein [Vibrio sp. S11_S32]